MAPNLSQILGTAVVPVAYKPPQTFHLPNWGNINDAERIAVLRRIVLTYGRDPRIAELAQRILVQAGAQPRDYRGQAAAFLRYVQGLYYRNEPGERLQAPDYTIKIGGGDCFPAGTLVLRDDYTFCPIEHVQPGMRIWGRDRWSTVEAVAEKGVLPVTRILLNNGSTVELTENHKVYVEVCPLHGINCPDDLGRSHNCADRLRIVERIRVSELRAGHRLIQPDSIQCDTGEAQWGPDLAKLVGLYLADGWAEANRFAISGKDGHPKEQQKREVAGICAKLGVPTRWHPRYIAVNDAKLAQLMGTCGGRAWEKFSPRLNFTAEEAQAIVDGLMADAGKNGTGSMTYSTTSHTLALQFRVLQRMCGRTCSVKYVADHGGLGKHPIWRLTVRQDNTKIQAKRLRVAKIEREVRTDECFDIQTDDHYVYLPESDVTVSNCDDLAILLGALLECVRLPWRFVLSGVGKDKQQVRWVEGEPLIRGVQWSHIYIAVGDKPFTPTSWTFAEPTLKGAPLGWDVVGARSQALPEMATAGLAGPMLADTPSPIRHDIRDPALDLRDAVKELLLLEDHLAFPDRRCPDCIRKHLLKVEALAEEAVQLDVRNEWAHIAGTLAQAARKISTVYEKRLAPPQAIAQAVRDLRKSLVATLGPAPLNGVGGLSGPSEAGGQVAASLSERGTSDGMEFFGVNWKQVGVAVLAGVAVSVSTQVVLDKLGYRHGSSRGS